MENKIKQISPTTEQAILRKTAYALPDRPSESGMKSSEIKKAFYSAITDSNDSIMSEMKRIIDEFNISNNELENTISNSNLLVNGNFEINQRGKEIYDTQGYCVDGWYFNGRTLDDFIMSFNAKTKTLRMYNTSTTVVETSRVGLFQYIENSEELLGKTVTVSVKANGKKSSISETIANSYTEDTIIAITNIDTYNDTEKQDFRVGGLILAWDNAKKKLVVKITIWANKADYTIQVSEAKLEIGTSATTFQPRPYSEELALCQYAEGGINNISKPNLLINSNFELNQRGEEIYKLPEYCVDAWYFAGITRDNVTDDLSGDYSVNLSEIDNFITTYDSKNKIMRFYNNTTNISSDWVSKNRVGLYQYIQNNVGLLGKQVTISANINGYRYSSSATIEENYSSDSSIISKIIEDVTEDANKYCALRLDWDNDKNQFVVKIVLWANNNIDFSINVSEVKLEIGNIPTIYSPERYIDNFMNSQFVEGGINKIISNPNLLVNGNFEINQRGKEIYNGEGYSADGWYFSGFINSNGKYLQFNPKTKTVSSNLTTNVSYGRFYLMQDIKNSSELFGKIVTLSYEINGKRYSKTCQIADSYSSDTYVLRMDPINFTVINDVILFWNNDKSLFQCKFVFYVRESSVTITNVKLEYGPVATEYISRPYAEELAMCQFVEGGVMSLSNPNLVINGDFSVNQKGKSRYSNSGYYTADGWQLGKNNDGYFDVSTKTLSCGISGTYAILTQYVNVDIVSLKGKQLTLSADIEGDGINTVYLQFGYFTGSEFTQIALNIIKTAPTTISRYVVTGTIPDNVTSVNKLAVRPYINAGSCVIDKIKLELGSVATTYSQKPYSEELAICQMPSISGNQNLSTTYSNENILINGDFRVNQRNFTSTTDVEFTVDRWKNARANTSVTLNDDGTITLSSTPTQTQNTLITQKLEEKDYKNLLGGAITVSAMVSLDEGQTYNVYSISAVLPETLSAENINNETYFTDDSGVRHGSVRQYWTGSQFVVDVFGYNGYNVRVKWVKLEKGQVATPYSPRPYAEELSMCQRFYQVCHIEGIAYTTFGQILVDDTKYYGANALVSLPTTLRTRPTVTITQMPYIRNYNNLNEIASGYTEIIRFVDDIISLQFYNSNVERGVIYYMYNGTATLDAEIY